MALLCVRSVIEDERSVYFRTDFFPFGLLLTVTNDFCRILYTHCPSVMVCETTSLLSEAALSASPSGLGLSPCPPTCMWSSAAGTQRATWIWHRPWLSLRDRVLLHYSVSDITTVCMRRDESPSPAFLSENQLEKYQWKILNLSWEYFFQFTEEENGESEYINWLCLAGSKHSQ